MARRHMTIGQLANVVKGNFPGDPTVIELRPHAAADMDPPRRRWCIRGASRFNEMSTRRTVDVVRLFTLKSRGRLYEIGSSGDVCRRFWADDGETGNYRLIFA